MVGACVRLPFSSLRHSLQDCSVLLSPPGFAQFPSGFAPACFAPLPSGFAPASSLPRQGRACLCPLCAGVGMTGLPIEVSKRACSLSEVPELHDRVGMTSCVGLAFAAVEVVGGGAAAACTTARLVLAPKACAQTSPVSIAIFAPALKLGLRRGRTFGARLLCHIPCRFFLQPLMWPFYLRALRNLVQLCLLLVVLLRSGGWLKMLWTLQGRIGWRGRIWLHHACSRRTFLRASGGFPILCGRHSLPNSRTCVRPNNQICGICR